MGRLPALGTVNERYARRILPGGNLDETRKLLGRVRHPDRDQRDPPRRRRRALGVSWHDALGRRHGRRSMAARHAVLVTAIQSAGLSLVSLPGREIGKGSESKLRLHRKGQEQNEELHSGSDGRWGPRFGIAPSQECAICEV